MSPTGHRFGPKKSRISPGRQFGLATRSIVMLRLTFLSDVGQHAAATGDSVRKVRNPVEGAHWPRAS